MKLICKKCKTKVEIGKLKTHIDVENKEEDFDSKFDVAFEGRVTIICKKCNQPLGIDKEKKLIMLSGKN